MPDAIDHVFRLISTRVSSPLTQANSGPAPAGGAHRLGATDGVSDGVALADGVADADGVG